MHIHMLSGGSNNYVFTYLMLCGTLTLHMHKNLMELIIWKLHTHCGIPSTKRWTPSCCGPSAQASMDEGDLIDDLIECISPDFLLEDRFYFSVSWQDLFV